MPTYDYHCSHCGHHHELLQKITEVPLTTCPQCHKETLRRGPGGGVGLMFTGTGFYVTDYPSQKNKHSENTVPSKTQENNKGSCACNQKGCKG